MNRFVTALALGAAFLAPVASSAQGFPPRGPMFYRHHAEGRIIGMQGSSFRLASGRTVFLKQGTVINPTGFRLRPGIFVRVTGSPAGDRNVNAQVVNVLPRR